MRRSTRTFLFFLFTILFLLIAPMVIGYSQGYRLDWQNKNIVQTGALFLEPRPAPVEVYLNGKLKKRSSFVFQNIFLGNLLPQKYLVEVKKESYYPWQKSLTVSPKLVSEAKNITLFPVPDPSKVNRIKTNVKDFFPSPSGEHFIFLLDSEVPKMSLYSLIDQREILTFSTPGGFAHYAVGNVQWNRDSTNIIFSIKMGNQKKWIFVDLSRTTIKSVDLSYEIVKSKNFRTHTKKLYKPTITDLRWNPDNPGEIFFVARDNSTERLFFSYNIESAAFSELLAYDMPAANEKDSSSKKISADVEKAIVARDQKKILLIKKSELAVYWLETTKTQPFRDAGDYEQIVNANEQTIGDAVWFSKNNEYVVFSMGNSINVTELDGRDNRNTHVLINSPAKKIFYEEKNEVIYFLDNDTMHSLSLKYK